MDDHAIKIALLTLIGLVLISKIIMIVAFFVGAEWAKSLLKSPSLSVEEIQVKDAAKDVFSDFQGAIMGGILVGMAIHVMGLVGAIKELPTLLIVYGTLIIICELINMAQYLAMNQISLMGLPIVSAIPGILAILLAVAIKQKVKLE